MEEAMNLDIRDWKWFNIGSFITGICIIAITGYTFVKTLQDNGDFGVLAVLIMVSLTALIGIMNLLTYAAKRTGIADAKQAFGLPEGSVRAILTMAFIVLVGILASYLVVNSGEQSPYSRTPIPVAQNVSEDLALDLKKSYEATGGLILIEPSAGQAVQPAARATDTSMPTSKQSPQPPGSAPPGQPTSGQPAPDKPTPGQSASSQPTPDQPSSNPPNVGRGESVNKTNYDIWYYPKVDHRLGEDISKQILTMLSTILAAMIGFYFGARPGEGDSAAVRRATAIAKIESIISGAPNIDDLEKKLVEKSASDAEKVTALKARLAIAKADFNDAASARLSADVTTDQMQEKAAKAGSAVKALQTIESEIAKL
jgi:uncharacterized membrane protein required for colicin V production